MNLADYLSELLGQHDEVSMPGLGYFVRERISGYYNDAEGKFYPPFHRVNYVPLLKDDDRLAQYIADKRNISLPTSKYFAEKFVEKLKEEATAGAFTFSDLGWFHIDNGQLIFNPKDKMANDPFFFGFEPLSLPKLNRLQEQPVVTELSEEPGLLSEPVEIIEAAEVIDDQPVKKKRVSAWLWVVIAAAILALAAAAAFYFYPDEINKMLGNTEATAPVKTTIISKTDTVKKVTPVKDTSATKDTTVKTVVLAPQVNDTLTSKHFEVIIDAERKLAVANSEMARYKKIGLDVKIAIGVHGRLIKLTAGTYFTKEKADSALTSLIKSGKISNQSYVIPILPQK